MNLPSPPPLASTYYHGRPLTRTIAASYLRELSLLPPITLICGAFGSMCPALASRVPLPGDKVEPQLAIQTHIMAGSSLLSTATFSHHVMLRAYRVSAG
eukprot:827876-Rhodomonas_salina.2